MKSNRRPHRPKEKRAYSRGYIAGARGYSEARCPHCQLGAYRAAWYNGWRQGRQDYLAGFRAAS